MVHFLARAAAFGTIWTLAAWAVGATGYSVVPIEVAGHAGGGVVATAINDAGGVAVWTSASGEPARAFLWAAGVAREVPTPALADTFTSGIGAGGSVTGWSNDGDGIPHGFVWSPSIGLKEPSVPGGILAGIRAVNDRSQIVGTAWDGPTGAGGGAYVFDGALNPTRLPDFGMVSSPVAINNLGQIVGTSGNTGSTSYPLVLSAALGQQHAVLWQGGEVVDLTPGTPWSCAYDINDSGQVVGYRLRPVSNGDGVAPNLFETPFIWDAGHGAVDLPMLSSRSSAVAINDAGEIVGDAEGAGAVLWEDGAAYDLNSLIPADSGWVLLRATDINSTGQIIGDGTFNGQPAAFLLTPDGASGSVPEPGCGVVLVAAGVRLVGRRRT